MRSNLEFILQRIGENLAESGTDILLTWDEYPPDTPVDEVTQTPQGTPTQNQKCVKGFVHLVQASTMSTVKQFNEIETGDCIVDLAPDADIDGKLNLRFIIAGETWCPKQISDKLGRAWDVVVQGQRLYRSVLLRKA